jgi:hypothetical protein
MTGTESRLILHKIVRHLKTVGPPWNAFSLVEIFRSRFLHYDSADVADSVYTAIEIFHEISGDVGMETAGTRLQ